MLIRDSQVSNIINEITWESKYNNINEEILHLLS